MSGSFVPENPFDEQPLPAAGDFASPDLEEEVRYGQACRFVIESGPYKLVMARMQDTVWEGFKMTPLRDTEGLAQLRMMQHCITKLHELLAEGAETGKLAAAQLIDPTPEEDNGSDS